MLPTRIISHAALACALTIAAVLTSAPAAARPAHPSPAAVATIDGCDQDDPYPVHQADLTPLMVKPPGGGDGTQLLDGTLPAGWAAEPLERLAHLRPRAHLPDGHARAVDTRPA